MSQSTKRKQMLRFRLAYAKRRASDYLIRSYKKRRMSCQFIHISVVKQINPEYE